MLKLAIQQIFKSPYHLLNIKNMELNYIGEIRMFAGQYAPANWHLCDGTVLPMSGYEMLGMLLGSTYGGDGFTNFAVPDLRGRITVGTGRGRNISGITLGESGGQESIILNPTNLPAHHHSLNGTEAAGTTNSPNNTVIASAQNNVFVADASAATTLMANTIGNSGGVTPVQIVQPYTVINYIIALTGIYPSPK